MTLKSSNISFASTLIDWYEENKRPLEWRETKDPYKIWLSEIILQQTQVSQGRPYYRAFLKAYPTVSALAQASENDVMRLWQGLGYYSRARNLHSTARYITYHLKNQFPSTYKELIKLKGIGEYTASAISSFCFDECVPTVDGNVYRVLSRYFGITTPINSSQGTKVFKKLAQKVMKTKHISQYNQSIMEFGALQCKPRGMDCNGCVLNLKCVAFSTGKVKELPIKIKKLKIKHRYFNYFIIKDSKNNVLLNQRLLKDIWMKLYEFPLIETKNRASYSDLHLLTKKLHPYVGKKVYPKLLTSKELTHKLTHQHLHTQFWYISLDTLLKSGIPIDEVDQYPMPVLLSNFFKKFRLSLQR